MDTDYTDLEFPIFDAQNNLQAIHVRREFALKDGQNKPEKRFLWRRPDGTYGTPDGFSPQSSLFGLEFLRGDASVVVTEGETAAKQLQRLGIATVATVCGAAGVPTTEVLENLIGKTVYLWPDNDDKGRVHMEKTAERLHSLGITTYMMNWKDAPLKGDAADLIAQNNGSSLQLISKLKETAVLYEPDQGDNPVLLTPQILVGQYVAEAQEIAKARDLGVPYKTPTGFRALDKLIGGGFRRDLINLHARGGTGKSAFLMQIAAQSEIPTLFVSVEMDTQELTRRLVGFTQNVPMHRLLNDDSNIKEETELVRAAYRDAPYIHMIDASTKSVSIDVLRQYLKVLQEKSTRDGRVMLMVDSINEWAARLPDADPTESSDMLAHGVRGLRTLSNEFKMPVWFTAHRTISGHGLSNKEAANAMAAGSMVLQHEPDWVFGLEKKKDDSWVPGKPSEMQLHLLKGRKGPAGFPLSFLFQGEVMRFSEVG